MDLMCPVCNNLVTLVVDPENPTRLIGKCGHFPGGFPHAVFDIPNPDYKVPAKLAGKEPEKPVSKPRSKNK